MSINIALMKSVIVFIVDLENRKPMRDESMVRESVEFEVLWRKEKESGVNECKRRKVGL